MTKKTNDGLIHPELDVHEITPEEYAEMFEQARHVRGPNGEPSYQASAPKAPCFSYGDEGAAIISLLT